MKMKNQNWKKKVLNVKMIMIVGIAVHVALWESV